MEIIWKARCTHAVSRAGTNGGGDFLLGGFGQDQVYGGGGDDALYGGPDSDWLEAWMVTIRFTAAARRHHGPGHRFEVLDLWRYLRRAFGNNTRNDAPDDGAVDILRSRVTVNLAATLGNSTM